MGKAETLKRELDMLSSSMLGEVERIVKKLKKQSKIARKPATLLSELAAHIIDDELPSDQAEQHDHYLYGGPKKCG
jgi:hypothetical protein